MFYLLLAKLGHPASLAFVIAAEEVHFDRTFPNLLEY